MVGTWGGGSICIYIHTYILQIYIYMHNIINSSNTEQSGQL